MENISLWKAISDQSIAYPKLKKNIEVDVAIIGAGITGLTAALQLIESGKKVANVLLIGIMQRKLGIVLVMAAVSPKKEKLSKALHCLI